MPDQNTKAWSFTHINHARRKLLHLSMNDYALVDLVHHRSSHPGSSFPGWCYASKNRLADDLGVSKRSILNMLDRLEEKGLIQRHPETKYLRSTPAWYDTAYLDGEETAPAVKKLHRGGEQTAPPSGEETAPNNKNTKQEEINEVSGDAPAALVSSKGGGEEIDVASAFQSRASYLRDRLGSSKEHVTSLLKVCRDEPPGRIEDALSYALDYPNARDRTRVFFFRLQRQKLGRSIGLARETRPT